MRDEILLGFGVTVCWGCCFRRVGLRRSESI